MHLYRDYFINHDIRIPSLNNPDDSRKVSAGCFFFLWRSTGQFFSRDKHHQAHPLHKDLGSKSCGFQDSYPFPTIVLEALLGLYFLGGWHWGAWPNRNLNSGNYSSNRSQNLQVTEWRGDSSRGHCFPASMSRPSTKINLPKPTEQKHKWIVRESRNIYDSIQLSRTKIATAYRFTSSFCWCGSMTPHYFWHILNVWEYLPIHFTMNLSHPCPICCMGLEYVPTYGLLKFMFIPVPTGACG